MSMTSPPPPQTTFAGSTDHYNLRYIWLISLVAAMGGLLFGYDWVVIGGAKPFFEPFFRLDNEAARGWANSCALLGCLAGALFVGALSDLAGRKRLLILSALLFAVSSVFTGWASNFHWFVTWRMLGGVAIGMASGLSPMYIAEVAPAHLRGRLVAINQLTIVIGVLAAQVVNWLIARPVPDNATADFIRESWNAQYGWRWMFTAVTVPSLLFFVGSMLIPESPRWLVKSGRADRARDILSRIGGAAYGATEVQDIQDTLARGEIGHVRFADLLTPKMLKILWVGVVLAVLQQWSGINVIFNYAEEIFREAGYGVSSILFNIVITGVVMLLFTLIAIQTVDRFGRRALMLIGCAGIALFHTLIGLCYMLHLKGLIVVVPVMATIACYSFSLAPVTWVLISEIYPNRIRGAAVAVTVSALWIACFILTYTFPLLNHALGPAMTFWLYAAICAAGFVFIFMRVPETKGKTLEAIERELVD
ncbi:MAG: sugar porter family MFS transporter [Verrucomicrobia bacterium]|nr:sugar porter family MFS transporter [Verrucomicrobiota bacterium]